MYSSMDYGQIMDRSVLADERERNAARQAVIDAQNAQIHARRVKGWDTEDAMQAEVKSQADKLGGLMVPGVNAPLNAPDQAPQAAQPAGPVGPPNPDAMGPDVPPEAAAPTPPINTGLQKPKADPFAAQRAALQSKIAFAQKSGARADLDEAHKLYGDLTMKETALKIGQHILGGPDTPAATDDEMKSLVANIHGDPTNTISGHFDPKTGYAILSTEKGTFQLNRKELVQYLVAEAQGNIDNMLKAMGGPQARADAETATTEKITPINNTAKRYGEAGLEASRYHDMMTTSRDAATAARGAGRGAAGANEKVTTKPVKNESGGYDVFAMTGPRAGDMIAHMLPGGMKVPLGVTQDIYADTIKQAGEAGVHIPVDPESGLPNPYLINPDTGVPTPTFLGKDGKIYNNIKAAISAKPGHVDSGKPPVTTKPVVAPPPAGLQQPARGPDALPDRPENLTTQQLIAVPRGHPSYATAQAILAARAREVSSGNGRYTDAAN